MGERVGQDMGHYRLIQQLGRGGFAEVYLAEHRYLKSYAALKLLHTSLTQQDITRFRKKAQTYQQRLVFVWAAGDEMAAVLLDAWGNTLSADVIFRQ